MPPDDWAVSFASTRSFIKVWDVECENLGGTLSFAFAFLKYECGPLGSACIHQDQGSRKEDYYLEEKKPTECTPETEDHWDSHDSQLAF